MAYHWSRDKIRWYLDASAYTGFHGWLAGLIAPELDPDDAFCDIGCGLGRIDLEVARLVKTVTAVDIDGDVLEILREDARGRGIENLAVRRADAKELDERFDVIFMSFFGYAGGDVERFRRLCRKKLISVVNADNSGNLYPSEHRHTRKLTAGMLEEELREAGIAHQVLRGTAEFGQPLRSMEDALAYVADHAPQATRQELERFLGERLERTKSAEFPLYLPNPKEICVFVVEGDSAE